MTMIPDQIMEAIRFAEQVMEKEKRDRLGHSEATVYPMKFFFFHDKAITGLMDSPCHHPVLDDKDVTCLVVRATTTECFSFLAVPSRPRGLVRQKRWP